MVSRKKNPGSAKALRVFSSFGITKASQLKTKSDQWFEDVQFLFRNERYSAAVYLGGFVIECLLKASLWSRRQDDAIRSLIFRSHDLPRLLHANSALERDMQRDKLRNHAHFVQISSWHVRIRYNPRQVHREDADAFLAHLREVRTWLRDRI